MINYGVISDIHLYHRRTPTKHITAALLTWLDEYESVLQQLDVFYVAGDLFERAVMSSHADVRIVTQTLHELGRYCAKHNITLVFLEGTSWHDRGQLSGLLPMLSSIHNLSVEYITTVCVRHYQGTSVLFVPDNWSPDPETTYKDVLEAIHKEGLSQVDMAIMHGAFDHQLPKGVEGMHDRTLYEALVKTRIHIGHIHTPSVKGKVHAQGSFDRLAHNEEHPKGGEVVIKGKLKRLVNNNSYPYKQVVLAEDLVAATQQLTAICDRVAERGGGWVKVKVPRAHPILLHLTQYNLLYTTIHIEREYTDVVEATVFTPSVIPQVRDHNLRDLYSHYLKTHHSQVDPAPLVALVSRTMEALESNDV